jgi:hypothetical protein
MAAGCSVSTDVPSGPTGLDTAEPLLPGGEVVSLDEARAKPGFEILIPDHQEANGSTIDEVWYSESDNMVGVIFASGIVQYWQPTPYGDAHQGFEERISEGGADMRLIQVRGHEALIIEPDTDVEKANPAWLDFVEEGVLVSLWSYDHTAEDLIAVAESMS